MELYTIISIVELYTIISVVELYTIISIYLYSITTERATRCFSLLEQPRHCNYICDQKVPLIVPHVSQLARVTYHSQ